MPITSGSVDLGTGFGTNVAPHKRYIDFIRGSDLAGDGSFTNPWKTLQHAYDNSLPSINEPYTFYVSGGNNDTDTGIILAKPNVSIVADYLIQINQALTITGGTTNDGCTFTNIIFIGAVTWIRNDFSLIGVTFNNCQFFNGPIIKQTGTGSASITASNCVFVNMNCQLPRTGSYFMNCTFLGNTVFGDADSSAYYEVMGGYSSSPMSFFGGIQAYFSGIMIDAPFGATLTGTTTANGTPIFQTDDASVPDLIAGNYSLILTAHSQYINYTPSDSTKWANPQPTTITQAINRIAAVVGATVPIP